MLYRWEITPPLADCPMKALPLAALIALCTAFSPFAAEAKPKHVLIGPF